MAEKKLNYQVKRCTPKAMKVYDELALQELDGATFLKNWQEVAKDAEKLKKLCVALFGDEFEGADYENDIDLERVLEGVCFFGQSALGILRGLKRSTTNSPAPQAAGLSQN